MYLFLMKDYAKGNVNRCSGTLVKEVNIVIFVSKILQK